MTLPLPSPSVTDWVGIQQNFDALAQQFPINVRNLTSPENWHVVGAPNEIGFTGGWVDYGGGYQSTAFYKDPFGVVRMRGMVKSGTGAILTLPVGYRPSGWALYPAVSNGVFAYVQISPVGAITTNGSNAYVSLDSVSFRAA